jgi:hypothetical protein
MGGGHFYNQNAISMQEYIPLIEQSQQQQQERQRQANSTRVCTDSFSSGTKY